MSNKKVTIKEVAKEAGVSVSTVSRVLREYDNVPKETHDKVHEAIDKLQYIPNIAAANLGSGSLKNIGIVVTRSADSAFQNPFFSEMIMGIGSVLEKHDYNIQLIMTNDIDKERKRVVTALASGLIQGVILLYSRKYDMLIQDLANTNYPFVVSGRVDGIDSDRTIYSVNTDNASGSFTMVDHLIKLGHSRIAIVNGPMEYIVNIDRYDGYRRALVMNKIPYDPTLEINGGLTFQDAKASIKEAIEKNPDITAIYCKDDMKAVATIQGIKEMGLRVPEDIAVVGYNDYDIASLSSPQLTTMNVPIYKLGKASAQMIVNLIEDQTIEVNPEILPTNIVIRESCGYNNKNK